MSQSLKRHLFVACFMTFCVVLVQLSLTEYAPQEQVFAVTDSQKPLFVNHKN